jgi:hypothetical protein
MSTQTKRRPAAAALLCGLLPALAGVAAVPAQANDRDLRGTPVPAAACEEFVRTGFTGSPWRFGNYGLTGAGKLLSLRCPLPVNRGGTRLGPARRACPSPRARGRARAGQEAAGVTI